MKAVGNKFWRAFKFWAVNSYQHMLKMSVISAILAVITVAGVYLNGPHNPLTLFAFLFIMYMLTLELIFRIVGRNPQILFHDLTYDIKNLEDDLKQREDISKEVKFQLSFKFKEIDLFIQKIIGRPFLYSNFYDPDVEVDNIMHMIHAGIISYNEKWAMMCIDKDSIKLFNEVHGYNTEKYIKKITDALKNESSPYTRRNILRTGLYKLMHSSIKDFVRLVGNK